MNRRRALPFLFLALLLLSGCAERTFSDKTVVEWSRGRRVGVAAQSEPVALAVWSDGQRIALVWSAGPERGIALLHVMVMDGRGTVLTDNDLPFPVTEPSGSRLAIAGQDRLHLVWLDKKENLDSLFHAQITLDGQLVSSPQQLSEPGFRVNGHEVAILPSGELLVVWSTRLGLRAARISTDGQIDRSEIFEAPDASRLDLQVDDAGLVHVAWQQSFSSAERRLFYTTLDTANLTFSWPTYLVTQVLKTGTGLGGSPEELNGPILALETDQVVVCWAIGEIRGTNDDAFYVSFDPDGVKELSPKRIAVSSSYQPDYTQANGSFPYRQLASALPFEAVAHRTFLRSAPATVAGRVEEVPLAVSLWLRTSWSLQLQPALVYLDEGKVKGFQVVGWSRYPSLHPTLATDGEGDLYLAWIDAAGKTFPVYVASTAPSLQGTWDKLTRSDLLVALERLLSRIISVFGVVLVAISWLFLPGFCLIIVLFLFRQDSLDATRGKVALLSLIGLHWAGKYLFTSEMLTALPRLSDLPLIFPLLPVLAPETFAYLANRLQLPPFMISWTPYIVPSLTLVIGATFTRLLYLRRSRYPKLIPAYLILAIVDVFLALQLYALTYYDPIMF